MAATPTAITTRDPGTRSESSKSFNNVAAFDQARLPSRSEPVQDSLVALPFGSFDNFAHENSEGL